MKKFNINSNPEKLSDQEINQQMNFDSFVSGYTPAKINFFKTSKFYSWTAAATVVTGIAAIFVYKSVTAEKPVAYVPFITPPIAALDVPKKLYEIETASDTVLLHATGSQVAIPKGAFTNADGKEVSGKIDLYYREFHNPADLIVSGIPMQYDSAGKSWTFESGGMFEIQAYQDGKPLQIKPDKAITVNMISATNENNYNMYYLDTVARKWDYVSANTAENGTCKPVYEINKDREDEFRAAEAADPVPVAPARPAAADPDAYNFTIDYLKADFPELEVYADVKFQIDPNDKSYNPKLANKTWDDISIEKQEDGVHYTVTFREAETSQRFTVTPVVEGVNFKEAQKAFESKNMRYSLLMQERKQRKAERMDSLYRLNETYIGDSRRSELNERLKTYITGTYGESSKDLLAFRTFRVRTLGIWNCDRPRDFFDNLARAISSAAFSVFAVKFVNKHHKPIIFKNVYLTKKGVNSMFQIAEKDFGTFPAVTDQLNAIIGITYSGELYYLNDETLQQAASQGQNVTLQMYETDSSIKTTNDLKHLLKSGR